MMSRVLCMCLCMAVCVSDSFAMDDGGNWTIISKTPKNVRKKKVNTPKKGDEDFIRACLQGNTTKVLQRIDSVDIDGQVENGFDALTAASINGYVDIVEELVGAGANVHQCNKKGQTALFGAAANGRLEVATTLLQHGAYFDQTCDQGSTPLMHASATGTVPVVKLLVDRGAGVNRQDLLKGRASLHWVLRMREGSVQKKAYQHCSNEVFEKMEFLLKSGANPFLRDKSKTTPIEWAARLGCSPEEIAMLLRYSKINK